MTYHGTLLISTINNDVGVQNKCHVALVASDLHVHVYVCTIFFALIPATVANNSARYVGNARNVISPRTVAPKAII